MTKGRSSFQNLNATRITATTIGVFFGLFSGVNHGFFEFLQIGLEIAIFGFFPGLTDPVRIENTAMLFVFWQPSCAWFHLSPGSVTNSGEWN